MTLSSEAEARDWFAKALGCNETTIGKLDHLVLLLREENARQNLVSAASLESVWLRHLADSAQLLVVPRETPSGPWLDLGSGAGFPGLVVALCRPDIEVILVENRKKRSAWLEAAMAKLGIANASVAGASLQSIETMSATTISARAFAPFFHTGYAMAVAQRA
jgi:16S rRNA (guanine527-N7)-methyltransferase